MKVYLFIGALLLGSLLGGTTGWRLQDGKVARAEAQLVKAQALAAKYKGDAEAWHRAYNAWREAFGRSEGLREDEHERARGAVKAEQNACSTRVAQVRASAKAMQGLFAQPVKANAAGCPAPRLFTTDELRAVLRPAGR